MQELLAYLHQIGLHSLIFWHSDAAYRTAHTFSQLFTIFVSRLFHSYDTEN